METIHIKSIESLVSRIGLGTWSIGGWMWGGTNKNESIQTILTAFHKGINLIDTAPVYGFGESEKIVGDAIKQFGARDKIIIATKAGLNWHDGKLFRDSKPERIRQEIEDSLQRLQVDYIDLYQIHWPDPRVPMEETAETMLQLFNEGKIRAIGVSNFSVTQMKAFLQVAPIHTSQPPYNLFERDIEKTILPFTEAQQIVTLGYGALCRGFLSGRLHKNTVFQGDDVRQIDPKFRAPLFEIYLNAVQELENFARHEFGKSVLALSIRWVLDRGHTIALWGARHPEQLNTLDEIFDWNIDAEAMQGIDAILEKWITEPLNPDFLAPPARTDHH